MHADDPNVGRRPTDPRGCCGLLRSLLVLCTSMLSHDPQIGRERVRGQVDPNECAPRTAKFGCFAPRFFATPARRVVPKGPGAPPLATGRAHQCPCVHSTQFESPYENQRAARAGGYPRLLGSGPGDNHIFCKQPCACTPNCKVGGSLPQLGAPRPTYILLRVCKGGCCASSWCCAPMCAGRPPAFLNAGDPRTPNDLRVFCAAVLCDPRPLGTPVRKHPCAGCSRVERNRNRVSGCCAPASG